MKNLNEIKNHLEYPKDIQDDFLKLSLFAKDHLSFRNDPFLYLKNGVLDNVSHKDFLINYINKTILKNKSKNEKDGMGIDLWYTGTYSFTKTKVCMKY